MKTHVMVVACAVLAVAFKPLSLHAEPAPEKADSPSKDEAKTEVAAPSTPPVAQAPAAPVAPAKAPTAPSTPAKPQELTDATVVASWVVDGKPQTLTFKQLKDERKAAFRRLEQERYNTIQREVEGYMLDKLLNAEAARHNKTSDEYIKSLAEAVSPEEVKKFYETTVSKDGKNPPFDSVEQRIRQYLSMKDNMPQIRKKAELKFSIPEPDIPLVEFDLSDRPRKGAKNAKLTLVEFSDFQCPYCSRAIEPLEEILKTFPEDVEVYFLHFPLGFHKQAKTAAIAARCAQKQGKFWEMHDLIFENQEKLADEDLKAHATTLKLDVAKYETCVKDPEVAKFVDADMAQGTEAGVGGTPSFFANGRALERPPTVEKIRSMLQ